MAGYSKTPLIKKLGIKSGYSVLPVCSPFVYTDITEKWPDDVKVVGKDFDGAVDFIHLFAKDAETLVREFPMLKQKLTLSGLLWVSWIKKSSSLETNISESDVRSLGLSLGLVDVKICAVDENWSGLKFVYRKKDR